MIGRPPVGCAGAGWLEIRKADAVMNATARDAGIAKRDAGIARPALLGLSRPNIRNPVSRLCRKLGRPAAGVNARAITLRGAVASAVNLKFLSFRRECS